MQLYFYSPVTKIQKTQNLYPTPADKLTLRPKVLTKRTLTIDSVNEMLGFQ